MQPLNAKNVSSKIRLRIISSKVRRQKTGEWPDNAAFAPCLEEMKRTVEISLATATLDAQQGTALAGQLSGPADAVWISSRRFPA
jgi:hypothetical protein